MPNPILIAKNAQTELALLPALANRHGCITGATGTGKTVTLQVLAESFSRIGTPVFMADVKGDLTGVSQAGAASQAAGTAQEPGPGRAGLGRQPGGAVGRVRRAGRAGPGHHLRHGTAAAGAHPGAERHPGRRAGAGVQGRRRRGPAAAGPEGPARHAAERCRPQRRAQDPLRQRVGRQRGRDPAQPADAGVAGRREILRRAHA